MLLMSDGDQVEITPKFIKKVKAVKTGKRYIDNMNNNEIFNDVVEDRQKLATDGIINVGMQLSSKTGKVIGKPIISTFGIIANKDDKKFEKEIETIIETYLLSAKIEGNANTKKIEEDIRGAIRKHVVRIKKLYPVIMVNVFLAN
jgi:ribonuclease J